MIVSNREQLTHESLLENNKTVPPALPLFQMIYSSSPRLFARLAGRLNLRTKARLLLITVARFRRKAAIKC